MTDMERQGITTSAIRNRARRREYQKRQENSELSKLFSCCGAEFVFDGFVQNDYQVQKELSKTAYEEQKQAKLQHEEKLRKNYGKMVRKKKQKEEQEKLQETK